MPGSPLPVTSPSFCVTLKMTGLPARGLPAPSVTLTTSGAGRADLIEADWLLPDSSRMRDCAVCGTRITVICVVAELPTRSRPTTRMTLGPSTSGTVAARNVRFATCAATPFTVTCACSAFTVPTTMSLMIPATEMTSSTVSN